MNYSLKEINLITVRLFNISEEILLISLKITREETSLLLLVIKENSLRFNTSFKTFLILVNKRRLNLYLSSLSVSDFI